MIWLPPGCKASSPKGNGYDIYDLYDLGEFDQKGSRATKWGTKEELVELCQTAKRLGVGVIWDAVLNHKAAADSRERCMAVKVNEKGIEHLIHCSYSNLTPTDRRKDISTPHEIESWTHFDFPGRANKYSSMHYSSQHFSGVDYDASRHDNSIFKIVGPNKKGWATDVDNELGNYDYLMFSDLDYAQSDVRRDVLNWGSWITEELGLSGFRLDAMKHYSQDFQKEFVRHMDSQFGRDFFFVGEYWKYDSFVLSSVIGKFKGRINLFDVQLVYNFSDISQEKQTDLRKVFDNALVQLHPQRAVVRSIHFIPVPLFYLQSSPQFCYPQSATVHTQTPPPNPIQPSNNISDLRHIPRHPSHAIPRRPSHALVHPARLCPHPSASRGRPANLPRRRLWHFLPRALQPTPIYGRPTRASHPHTETLRIREAERLL